MKAYVAIRDWVDGCLAGPRAMSIADVPLVLPIALTAVLTFSVTRGTAALIIVVIAASTWAGFVFWRGWRLGKADALKRDRKADYKDAND